MVFRSVLNVFSYMFDVMCRRATVEEIISRINLPSSKICKYSVVNPFVASRAFYALGPQFSAASPHLASNFLRPLDLTIYAVFVTSNHN